MRMSKAWKNSMTSRAIGALPDPKRPLPDRALRAARLVHPREQRSVHLLVDAGHARKNGGPDAGECVSDLERVAAEGEGVADVPGLKVDQTPVVVCEGQVEQQRVRRLQESGRQPVDARGHLEVVA